MTQEITDAATQHAFCENCDASEDLPEGKLLPDGWYSVSREPEGIRTIFCSAECLKVAAAEGAAR